MNGCFLAGFQSVVLVVSLVDWSLILFDGLVVDHGSSLHLLHLGHSNGLLLLSHFLNNLWCCHSLNSSDFWHELLSDGRSGHGHSINSIDSVDSAYWNSAHNLRSGS